MPKQGSQLSEQVMERIRHGHVRMMPRVYFILGSIAAGVGLVASVVASMFLFGVIRFSLRSHGAMATYRWAYMMENIPWWSFILALVGLTAGVLILRRYSFSYKHHFALIVIIFVLVIFAGGWLMDALGFNSLLLNHGPFQGFMRGYTQSGPSLHGGGPWWAK